MKVKVLNTFRDKYDHVTMHNSGTILEVNDEARVKDLISRGLVKEFKGNQKATAVLGEAPEPAEKD